MFVIKIEKKISIDPNKQQKEIVRFILRHRDPSDGADLTQDDRFELTF